MADTGHTASEVVTGQHGREATITRIDQGRFMVECLEQGPTGNGTRHTLKRTSYTRAYDAAEAWAWRGEAG